MTSEIHTRLQGEVYYLPKIALPQNCTLTVTLSDVSLLDVAATVIAVSRSAIPNQGPMSFALIYDYELLPKGPRTYALSARIELEGRLLWINNTLHPVELTAANQTGLKIRVDMASQQSDGFQGGNGISGGLQGDNGFTGGFQGDNGPHRN